MNNNTIEEHYDYDYDYDYEEEKEEEADGDDARGVSTWSPTTICCSFDHYHSKPPPSHKKRKIGPEDDDATNAETANLSSSSSSSQHAAAAAIVAVGTLVAVYWPDDDLYYRGTIARTRTRKHHHHGDHGDHGGEQFFVKYDDGDSEWVDPDTTIYTTLTCKADPLPPRKVSPALDLVKVGARLLVWWPVEEQYYEATVAKIQKETRYTTFTNNNKANTKSCRRTRCPKSTPFQLHYDDGDREWTDLANRNFVFQE
jgi:hypothetical protein